MNNTTNEPQKYIEEEISKLWAENTERFVKEYYGTFNPVPIPKQLTPESLNELIKLLYQQTAKTLAEIWFVDRHNEYMRLRKSCKPYQTDSNNMFFGELGSVYGVRIIEIDTHFPINKNAPWYAHVPGVWTIYGNGDIGFSEFKQGE